MRRTLSFLGLVFVSAVSPHRVLGQANWTDAQKIANAVTAAPSFISQNATVMEWQNGKPVTLRAGTMDGRVPPLTRRERGMSRCAWMMSGCHS